MYLGIEIGGTKLQLAVGPGDGTLVGLWRGTVDRDCGGAGIREQITAAVPDLLRQAGLARCHLHGAGVGFGGPVDDATQTVIKSHQIAGWDDFPLADWVSETLGGLPVALGNDADVAGLGEALFGAGQGLSPVFYVTIGSGIGGGLIVNGEIYRGCGKGAAEIGHLRVKVAQTGPDGRLIIADDILEHRASGWAIGRIATARAGKEMTAGDVADAARRGDSVALDVLRQAWTDLAEGLCQVIALLCPRRVVIGGGVALMGEELLFRPLRQLVAQRVFRPFADSYDIVPAALGEEVVLHGALALARQRFNRRTT